MLGLSRKVLTLFCMNDKMKYYFVDEFEALQFDKVLGYSGVCVCKISVFPINKCGMLGCGGGGGGICAP